MEGVGHQTEVTVAAAAVAALGVAEEGTWASHKYP